LETTFKRPTSEKVIIRGSNAKGVLFKEAAYPSWDLTIKSDGKSEKVPIYAAGPTVYGYMYAFVPESARGGNFEAIFEYHGEWVYKVAYLISFLSIILVLDLLFFKGILTKVFRKYLSLIHRRVGKWWEKEEEE